MSRPPTARFRLNAKRILLTYPQVDPSLQKEEVLRRLQEKSFGNARLESAIVARELHQDGTPHLHIVTCWTDKLNLASSKCFDFVTSKHGDYQGIKSWNSAVKYVLKEDKEPLLFGLTPQQLERCLKGPESSAPSKTTQLATSVFTGEKSLKDILRLVMMMKVNYSALSLYH